MAEDDFLHHRQPNAASLFRAVSGIIHPVKAVKYLFQRSFWHSRTVILEHQFRIVTFQRPFQRDHHSRIFFSAVSHRIGKKVIKDTFEFFPVQSHRKAAFSTDIFYLYLLVFHVRTHKFQIPFHIILEICFFHVITETGIQPAVFRQAVYQAHQIPCSCLYGLQIAQPLFRGIRNAVQQSVQISHNGGQRRPQVMGNSGNQIPPSFFVLQPLLHGLLQVGPHLVKISAHLAKLVFFLILHGCIQIPLPDFFCTKAQFSKRL